jgi:DNA repair photolyase
MNLPTLNNEIIKEAQKWVVCNKDLQVTEGLYDSPRISSELPDCSMPLTFDQYNLCSLGCIYCFAYSSKSTNPAIAGRFKLKKANITNLMEAIKGTSKSELRQLYYKYFYSKKFLLHWGGLADPFCNFEKHNWEGFKLINFLGEQNYPTLFSFKGDSIFENRYVRLFEKFSHQCNFAFQTSIITYNEKLADLVEIGVPSPDKRLKAIELLSKMGYWTILRLRPFIIGVSDSKLDDLLYKSLESGVNAISLEFFAFDCRTSIGTEKRHKFLGKIIGTKEISKYFSELSPGERGGYMRLNRLIKEPYVKKIYKFCINNNLIFACSDPDFKELNMSGSCCGMPDNFPKNKLLENWSKDQLTFHLRRLRKKFHKTGKRQQLNFSEVYSKSAIYLDDYKLCQSGNPYIINISNAERRASTLRRILNLKWNNLNSPANPRNYLHGQLMPCGLDDNGDLKYIYSPSEYEQRWKDEGIDLTK